MAMGCKKHHKKHCRGFSLFEVMIATFLIIVGMVSVVSLVGSGLNDSFDSRNQLIAGLLAQEGAELARNIRDNSWVAGGGSFNKLPNNIDNCPIDINDASVSNGSCNPNADLKLYYNNGFYRSAAAGGAATKFQRKLDFQQSGNKLTVTSMVVWNGTFQSVANCNAGKKCVYTQIILTKWGE